MPLTGTGPASGTTRARARPRMILGHNPTVWLWRTVRSKGVIRPFKVAWQVVLDCVWELQHATDTLSRVGHESLETTSANRRSATCYGATRARPLQRLFREITPPRNHTFVDLGAGKGRVLILAAQYGFQKVVGVEFSSALCEIARRNVAQCQKRRPWPGQVEILHLDVVDYPIQPDDGVFFLFHPFHGDVLARVVENLRQSLAAHPRRVCVIYHSPAHHRVLADSGLFAERVKYEFGGTEFSVYWTLPDLE